MKTPEQLQQENTELKSQLEALQAYVERLRVALDKGYDLVMIIRRASDSGDGGIDQLQHINDEANRALFALTVIETPTQSLNHIKARVEEETIERCKDQASVVSLVATLRIDNMSRKYAKQQQNVADAQKVLEKKEGE